MAKSKVAELLDRALTQLDCDRVVVKIAIHTGRAAARSKVQPAKTPPSLVKARARFHARPKLPATRFVNGRRVIDGRAVRAHMLKTGMGESSARKSLAARLSHLARWGKQAA